MQVDGGKRAPVAQVLRPHLGVQSGPSWGLMISQSRSEVLNGFFWQIGTATAFMFALVLAFNIVSDALQDAFDPRHV